MHTALLLALLAVLEVPPTEKPAQVAWQETEIVGPVTEDSLKPSLDAIKAAYEGETIRLYISSPGGDGFAMLEWLAEVDRVRRTHHVRLRCRSGALVASAAAIIFTACDIRSAAPTTVWLYHGCSSMGMGKAGHLEDGAKLARVLDWAVAVRIGPTLGKTPEEYVAWVDRRDNFLTTAEVAKLDHGLIVE